MESTDASSAEEEHNVLHFRHQHPLRFIEKNDHRLGSLYCFICQEQCLPEQPTYGCLPCHCFLHKSCTQLPRVQVQHPLHLHGLFSLMPCGYGFYCYHCSVFSYSLHFRCGKCDFNLCIKCFSLKPYRSGADVLPLDIKHPYSPERPLILQKEMDFWCDSCHKSFTNDWCFFSDECQMDIHCALMPAIESEEGQDQGEHLINHFRHQHPLRSIEIKNDSKFLYLDCYICGGYCSEIGQPMYGCVACKSFTHKSCTQLPRQIKHPFHPPHPLILDSRKYESFRCNACVFSGTCLFRFFCKHCNFNLCIKCYTMKPTIKYKSHRHQLCFMERILEETLKCDYCGNIIKTYNQGDDGSIAPQNRAFRCVQCDFTLHFPCGPLPCTIEHEDHGHALTYMDSVVEDNTGDYYCGLCQEERDPRDQVYYCANCNYIADLGCVISEVLHIIEGDCRTVEFRAAGEPMTLVQLIEKKSTTITSEKTEVQIDEASELITLKDIIETLSVKDQTELRLLLAPGLQSIWDNMVRQQEQNYTINENSINAEKNLKQITERLCSGILDEQLPTKSSELLHQEVDAYMITWNLAPIVKDLLLEYHDISRYTNKSFIELIERLCSGNLDEQLPIKLSELQQDVVEVGGYLITWNLAPTLKSLLDKYGDISSESKLSTKLKGIVYFYLCWAINSMCRTRFNFVTENLFLHWFYIIYAVKCNGFKVDFAIDRLNRVIRAYFGRQTMRRDNEILSFLD
ncbi:Cysteine/Histidine-rich C1 domain family protein [Quillaja saponaria]|uniref:Cysteine/Histidine-rich C1 domain family protein n=1 Tax=Quillaja saponaria TaxID=32244 RepID=A0AAD7KVV9_QUISA|nr:Cysteine/Histidine-rich C1 domain family protein [Quillaja saponaria]